MIHTRFTIFDSVLRLFKRLFKYADKNPEGFKNTLYAVILNDMKEWEEYVGEPCPKMDEILKKFLVNTDGFSILRFQEDLDSYRNVNVPLNNYTFRVIKLGFDLPDNVEYLEYDPTLHLYVQKTFSKSFITEFKSSTFKFLVSDSTLKIKNAYVLDAFNEDITDLFSKTTITKDGKLYTLYTFSSAIPLNEKVNITLE